MPDTREIFALRKAGNIEDAYQLAMRAWQEAPTDEWVVKAMGWVVYDKLKNALQQGDQEAIGILVAQAEQLNVSEDDEILFTNIHRLIAQAQPHRQRLTEARRLEEGGQPAAALDIFREIRHFFIGDAGFAESYGWCVYKNLKQLIDNEAGDISAYCRLLDEYFLINNVKPSRLHSNILRLAEKQSEEESFPLVDIFLKWNYEHFLEEDWKKNVWQDKLYPGLAEKTIQVCAKRLLQHGSEQKIVLFSPALDAALEKIDDNIWLFYYKAKLLVKTGRNEEAEAFLKPVVKQKRTEYWTWTLMGDIYKESSIEKALSCYCKALLCTVEEKFLTKARVVLSEMMVQKGFLNEAKTELLICIKTREELGYSITNDLQQIQQQGWFINALSNESNRQFYFKNKFLAEEILFADLPWISATIGESYTVPADPKTTKVNLYFNEGSRLTDIAVKDKAFKITRRFKPGDAVQLKAENIKGKWQVYLIEKRANGKKWDVFPEHIGVVDHVNTPKQVVHFIVDKNTEGIIRITTNQNVLSVGTIIKMRIKKSVRKEKNISEALIWEKTQDKLPLGILKPFSGVFHIKVGNLFGFVGDIFVEPSLVQLYELQNRSGEVINGLSVINYNINKREWGWKALSILKS